jgi:hypothetical protein
MDRWYTKLAFCLLPLAMVPLAFHALANGWVSLGGGDKNIIAVFPLAFWAVIYTMGYVVMWVRRSDARRCAGYAALMATLPLALGALGWLIWSLFPKSG